MGSQVVKIKYACCMKVVQKEGKRTGTEMHFYLIFSFISLASVHN